MQEGESRSKVKILAAFIFLWILLLPSYCSYVKLP